MKFMTPATKLEERLQSRGPWASETVPHFFNDKYRYNSFVFLSKDNGWSYDCNETGHEGPHEASYSAQMAPGNDGIIVFTKTRRTHPIPHGKSSHQKVRSAYFFHSILQIFFILLDTEFLQSL